MTAAATSIAWRSQPPLRNSARNTQVIAQVSQPEAIAYFRDDLQLDIDAYLTAVDTLRPLEGVDSTFGSPKESLDLAQNAAEAVKVMLQSDSVTQADVDAYNEIIGSTGDLLGSQLAINGAFDEACG